MNNRETFIMNLRVQTGKPYKWGADGPDAFDCSGLVSYAMGHDRKLNAPQLYEMYKLKTVSRMQALPGSLYFYGKDSGHISHVMTVLTHWDNGGITLIGARGGDSTVTSDDTAKVKKAFVDVCFGDYWLDSFLFAVDPFINP